MKKIYLAAAVLVLVIIVTGVYKKVSPESLLSNFSSKDIGIEAAKTKVVDFVENNMVQPGTEIEVKSAVKEGNLYKISFLVGAQDVDTYITQDGQKFFPSVIEIDAAKQKAADAQKAEEEAEKNIPKSDKPVVDLYVMSFCPYGNKAEDTIAPVYSLLKDKVDFNFRYIVNSSGDTIQSLHGQPEVDQNIREACVLQEYGKGRWLDFATYVNKNCGSNGSCWEEGAKSLSLDPSKIGFCAGSQGIALMKEDEKASNGAGAAGSPTMIINGQSTKAVYKYGDSEAYKQVICNAFTDAPGECSQVLGTETTSATEGGSCGT